MQGIGIKLTSTRDTTVASPRHSPTLSRPRLWSGVCDLDYAGGARRVSRYRSGHAHHVCRMAVSASDLGHADHHCFWRNALAPTPDRTPDVPHLGGLRASHPPALEWIYAGAYGALPRYTCRCRQTSSYLSSVWISQWAYGSRDCPVRSLDILVVAKARRMEQVETRCLRRVISHHHRCRCQSSFAGQTLAERRRRSLHGRRLLSPHLRVALRSADDAGTRVTDVCLERQRRGE
jgi:hypothetical protein